MEAVYVGVRRYDDSVVAEVFHFLFNAERHHHIVQLFIFVYVCSAFSKQVLRFAFQREDRLRFGVARRDYRARS